MSISQIQADGGVNPLKDQQTQQIEQKQTKILEQDQKGTAQAAKDSVEISERAKLYQEVDALKQDVQNKPNPSEARLGKIQDSIAAGTYITDEALDETAELLAARLF